MSIALFSLHPHPHPPTPHWLFKLLEGQSPVAFPKQTQQRGLAGSSVLAQWDSSQQSCWLQRCLLSVSLFFCLKLS